MRPQRIVTRTVSADPGLMTPEDLLKSHKDGRRKSLEELIAKNQASNTKRKSSYLKKCRDCVRWFLDSARLKISVSYRIWLFRILFCIYLTFVHVCKKVR